MKKDIESKKKSNNVHIFPDKRQNFAANTNESYNNSNYKNTTDKIYSNINKQAEARTNN